MKILVVDIGGTHVKVLATGHTAKRQFASGPTLTPRRMVIQVKRLIADWTYDVIALGFPGPVLHGRIVAEPHNLGRGWKAFDFARAFGRPVRLINDAAMQALGSYRGGRMLFAGIGTGLGTTLIADGAIVPMELGHLPYHDGRTFEDDVGLRGLRRLGKKKWRRRVLDVTSRLRAAVPADEMVMGGGNARLLKKVPPGTRIGNNDDAFKGGYRLWAETATHSHADATLSAGAGPARRPRSRSAGDSGRAATGRSRKA